MAEKRCMKCGHINAQAAGLESDACPACGAIYARVAAALAAGRLRPMPQPLAAPAPAFRDSAPSIPPASAMPMPPLVQSAAMTAPFIATLRAGSHYPTLREVVKILTFIGYVVWGLGGTIGALLALAKGQIAVGAGMATFCIFMVVMTKVFKEATLMVADLCDAAVVTAEKLSTAK
jgi:hypothetical protein